MEFYEKNYDIICAINSATCLCESKIHTGYKITHLDKQRVDLQVETVDGQVFYIEHKKRNHPVGYYSTVWLSGDKYDRLKSISNHNVVLFLVTWNDARGYINLRKVYPEKVSYKRRNSGNERKDWTERIVEFKISSFTFF